MLLKLKYRHCTSTVHISKNYSSKYLQYIVKLITICKYIIKKNFEQEKEKTTKKTTPVNIQCLKVLQIVL